ncbi:hypothetical protein L1987_05524 [Smallanthus sonchifolius]|uniref:Uncharacterized protein n=1 Tax=Smallanthus sonchifolius TaxID=185202 RepID=A0ACB9JVL8_9ASTR|nr:hypothetical protein L1987_05524 [Smallanthus sonchifolius]
MKTHQHFRIGRLRSLCKLQNHGGNVETPKTGLFLRRCPLKFLYNLYKNKEVDFFRVGDEKGGGDAIIEQEQIVRPDGMRIYRFKRLKPPLPTHLSPSRFLNRRYLLVEFEFGLDVCGVSELVFFNSELTPGEMTSRRNINYTRLAVDEDSKNTFDPRFDMSAETLDKVPWKSVGLALSLLLFGCVLLLLSLFIFTGHMGGDPSQAYGLFGLGTLTFLPGFYETRIAYYSWRGAHGFHFTAIPGY